MAALISSFSSGLSLVAIMSLAFASLVRLFLLCLALPSEAEWTGDGVSGRFLCLLFSSVCSVCLWRVAGFMRGSGSAPSRGLVLVLPPTN